MNQKTNKHIQTGANFLGLSFQTGILIFLGAWGGLKLDKWMETTPLFIILFSFIAIAFSMYYVICKATPKKNSHDDDSC